MIWIHVAIVLAVVCFTMWNRRSPSLRVGCAILFYLWFLYLLGGMYWTMRRMPWPEQQQMKRQTEYGVGWQDGAAQINKRFTDIWPPLICVYATGFLVLAVIPSGKRNRNEKSQPPAVV